MTMIEQPPTQIFFFLLIILFQIKNFVFFSSLQLCVNKIQIRQNESRNKCFFLLNPEKMELEPTAEAKGKTSSIFVSSHKHFYYVF